MQHTIKITKASDALYLVEATLANGFTKAQQCDSEEQARVYVRGLEDGFALVKNAIDIGLRFNGRIEQTPA